MILGMSLEAFTFRHVVLSLVGINWFVAVVQSFGKFAFLQKQAPSGSELPFAFAQAIVLLVLLVGGFMAVRRFHPEKRP
jgi:hypothetical protein